MKHNLGPNLSIKTQFFRVRSVAFDVGITILLSISLLMWTGNNMFPQQPLNHPIIESDLAIIHELFVAIL